MPKLRFSGGRLVIALPPQRISPASGSTKPATAMRIVVLPEPDGPSRVRKVPRSTSSETSSTATALP